jgi:hypothetical protein
MNPRTRIAAAIGLLVLALCVLGGITPLGAQEKRSLANFKYQYKVGLLPFVDNTGSGGAEVGVALGRAVQAELAHSTELVGRVLKLDEGTAPEDIDSEKAVEIARARKVDVVLVGTVLEADSEESEKSVSGPSVFGQHVSGSSRSVKAVVTLQGDLYSAATGKAIESIRVSGRASETKVGANVSTTLGDLSTGGASFQNSPIGKALHKAVADLVKRIAADQPKMVRYQPSSAAEPASGTEEKSAAPAPSESAADEEPTKQ